MIFTLVNTDSLGNRIVLSDLPTTIGRDPTADVRLTDFWVGEFQCLLAQDEDRLTVLDLGNRIGTFVNGVRINWKAGLMLGDTLTVGRSHFVVENER
jgi:pSer/pThr/pTyr-binding forkhead associated (FHA) protein